MALGTVFFICIDTSAKWLTLAGLPVLQVVFARYAGHFLWAMALFLPRDGFAAFRSASPRRQLLRALFLLASTTFNFAALQHLPITVTTTIFFAGPIVVTLLAIPLLGEVVGLRRLIAVCVGFGGVLVTMQPWGTAFHPAMFYCLGGLLCASLYFVMTRMLAGIDSNATSQLWASGVATAVIAPVALTQWVWPGGTLQWALVLTIGLWGALGHISATAAHRLAEASILAPVVYNQLLLASLAGIVVFDTWPTPWTLAGAAIIIGSGLYIWQRERKAKRQP